MEGIPAGVFLWLNFEKGEKGCLISRKAGCILEGRGGIIGVIERAGNE